VAGSGETPPRTAVVAKRSAEKLMELSNRKLPRNTNAAHFPRRPFTIGDLSGWAIRLRTWTRHRLGCTWPWSLAESLRTYQNHNGRAAVCQGFALSPPATNGGLGCALHVSLNRAGRLTSKISGLRFSRAYLTNRRSQVCVRARLQTCRKAAHYDQGFSPQGRLLQGLKPLLW
jgi:hypothetical protein